MKLTDKTIVIGAVLSVVLIWAFSETETGAAVINDVKDEAMKVTSAVRGIRNNNPGNIRVSGDNWKGLRATQTDGAFFQFTDMVYGVRALAVILRNYEAKYGLRTVEQIIARWAPSVENNTAAYIAAVSKGLGVAQNTAITTRNPDTLFALVRGIIKHEVGTLPALLISDSTVRDAIAMS